MCGSAALVFFARFVSLPRPAIKETSRLANITFPGCLVLRVWLERNAKVLYVIGHPGAAEGGDVMEDVLYVDVCMLVLATCVWYVAL